IAIALSCNPRMLIADEPTTALDVTIQAQILDLLRDIQEETNTAIVLITHDLGVVANAASRVAVMYGGKIVETGTVYEIIYDEKLLFIWVLLVPMPKQHVDTEELHLIPITTPDLKEPHKRCSFAARFPYVMKVCENNMNDYTENSPTHK